MYANYGLFTGTDNRKIIVSMLGQKKPELRNQTAKQLKNSGSVEISMHEHALAAPNAVTIMRAMEDLDKERSADIAANNTPVLPDADSIHSLADVAPTHFHDSPSRSPSHPDPTASIPFHSSPIASHTNPTEASQTPPSSIGDLAAQKKVLIQQLAKYLPTQFEEIQSEIGAPPITISDLGNKVLSESEVVTGEPK